jgi:hypothetical protein
MLIKFEEKKTIQVFMHITKAAIKEESHIVIMADFLLKLLYLYKQYMYILFTFNLLSG